MKTYGSKNSVNTITADTKGCSGNVLLDDAGNVIGFFEESRTNFALNTYDEKAAGFSVSDGRKV